MFSSSAPHLLARRPRLASLCEVCAAFADARICTDCIERFAPARLRCEHCAMVLPAGTKVCGDCLRDPPAWSRALCATDYVFPWDHLIVALKFAAHVELAAPLANMLARAVRVATAGVDLVLPIPLATPRLAERGFNQAWEIARRVARELALPADPTLLRRPLETAHQAELPRDQRAKNLRGAFMVDPRRHADVAGRHIAIVDDVLTTGATAREATTVLLRAGAASVEVWTVARTP